MEATGGAEGVSRVSLEPWEHAEPTRLNDCGWDFIKKCARAAQQQ